MRRTHGCNVTLRRPVSSLHEKYHGITMITVLRSYSLGMCVVSHARSKSHDHSSFSLESSQLRSVTVELQTCIILFLSDASTKFVKGTLSTTPPDTRTHDNRNVQHAMPEGLKINQDLNLSMLFDELFCLNSI